MSNSLPVDTGCELNAAMQHQQDLLAQPLVPLDKCGPFLDLNSLHRDCNLAVVYRPRVGVGCLCDRIFFHNKMCTYFRGNGLDCT